MELEGMVVGIPGTRATTLGHKVVGAIVGVLLMAFMAYILIKNLRGR